MMELLGLDSVLSTEEIRKLHIQHFNTGLVQLMGLLHFDRVFVRAEGTWVWDIDGDKYLDLLGGYGAINLGHNPPQIIDAIQSKCGVPNILQIGLGRFSAILSHNLAQLAPGDLQHTFFSNSGAESVEAALKFARAATGRRIIISVENSFHGKTMGALSITGKRAYQEPFDPMLPDCEIIPFGDIQVLEKRLWSKKIAAFIVEPILGEGGVVFHPVGYLKKAQELCRKYGTLFVLDEVQTGLGRTGRMFAAEHDGLEPDIMCLAKSLGGGIMPIGATLCTDSVWQKVLGGLNKCLRHTSTFGGNAWACIAGIATLQTLIEQDLPRHAQDLGEYIVSELRKIQSEFPFIKEVRGKGLLIGIEFQAGGLIGKAAYDFIGSMIAGELLNQHRIITAYTLNNPTVVRIEPPLVITKEEIDYFLSAFRQVLEKNRSAWKLVSGSIRQIIGQKLGSQRK